MILLHSFGHEQSLLSHNLSFLHPFHCYSHFLTSNHSLWLVCFTLLGWDLNYSALRRVNLARWPKERARKSIKLENAVFRKRNFESYWWGGDVRVIEGHYSYIQIDHHIFRLFFQMGTWNENEKSLLLWIVHPLIFAKLSQNCNTYFWRQIVGSYSGKYTTIARRHNFLFAYIYAQSSSQISASRLNPKFVVVRFFHLSCLLPPPFLIALLWVWILFIWTRNGLAGQLSKVFAFATSSLIGGHLEFADPELAY